MSDQLIDPNSGLPFVPPEEGGGQVRLLATIPLAGWAVPKLRMGLRNVVELLTEAKAREIVENRDRRPARERYGPEWILDQDGIGACNYYAMAGVLERTRFDRGGVRVPLWASAAYAREVRGSDRGSALSASCRDVIDKGVPPMSSRGNAREHVVSPSSVPAAAYKQGERFKGHETYWIETEQEAVTALALGFKMVIALTAGGSYGKLDKYGVSGGGGGMGNHALCLDDCVYDTAMGGWKLDQPNSWGTSWGDGGRVYLTWDRHIAGPLRNHGAWALRSAIDDPEGDNPPDA